MSHTGDILQALDAFIRKYYKNLLLKGALYAVAIVGVLFLAAVLLEHFGWLSSVARGVIFWGGMAAVAAVVAWYIVRPLVKMAGLGKRLGCRILDGSRPHCGPPLPRGGRQTPQPPPTHGRRGLST